MEFGRLERELVPGELRLPPDPSRNVAFGERHVQSGRAAFRKYVGLPVWANDGFVGPLYPEGTPKTHYLREYAKRCNAIELNATFYAVPTFERAKAWADETPEGFRFCPKVPKGLSHAHELNRTMLDAFIAGIQGFGDRLGPCFLQLPDWAGPEHKRALFNLLEALPTSHRFAVEVRHPSWFQDRATFDRFSDYLEKKCITFVITDAPSRRDVLHMALTAPSTFVRFLGSGHADEDARRIDEWRSRIETWQKLGATDHHFFVHYANEVEGVPFVDAMARDTMRETDKGAPKEPQAASFEPVVG